VANLSDPGGASNSAIYAQQNGAVAGTPPVRPGAWRGRRWLARLLDWLAAGTLSAIVCWPFAWESMRGLGTELGWSATSGLIAKHSLAATASSTAKDAMAGFRTVVVQTLMLQVGIITLYEWLLLALTGATAGKLLCGVRVRFPAVGTVNRSVGQRLVHSGLRALIAIVPGGAMVAAAVAAVMGSLVAVPILLLASSVALLDALVGLGRGGRTLHDRLTGSHVTPIGWKKAALAIGATAQSAGHQVTRGIMTALPERPARIRPAAADTVIDLGHLPSAPWIDRASGEAPSWKAPELP